MTAPRWLADTQGAAVIAGVAPGTIRSWASRGKLRRYGYDKHGRALYDAEEAEKLAATMDALENASAMCNTEPSAGACPPADSGWTVSQARAELAKTGFPIDRLDRLIWCLPGFQRTGEVRKPAGSKGGRGEALYPPGEFQRLHERLRDWLLPSSGDA